MCSGSRNTPTPTTTYVLIGSTLSTKTRPRFSVNSAARRWRSRRTTTNHADLSIAAETSLYLGKVGANLRGAAPVEPRSLPQCIYRNLQLITVCLLKRHTEHFN